MGREIVTIFTDGSCDNRIADCGAAAAVIRYKDKYREVVSGSWSSSTGSSCGRIQDKSNIRFTILLGDV